MNGTSAVEGSLARKQGPQQMNTLVYEGEAAGRRAALTPSYLGLVFCVEERGTQFTHPTDVHCGGAANWRREFSNLSPVSASKRPQGTPAGTGPLSRLRV